MQQWRRALRGSRGVLLASVIMLASSVLLPAVPALAATPNTDANTGSNLTTSPISVDLTIKPGQSQTTTLQVQNNGTAAIAVAVQLKEFAARGTSGQAAIVNPLPSDPSPSWVHFSQTTFTAQPGVWTPIQMTVSLPADAALGYYYAVLFKPVLPSVHQKDVNNVTLSNAILVLVDTQSGNENRSLSIASFTASHKIYEYLPANFTVVVKNNGNIFLPPQGVIYVSRSSSFTSTLATIDLNQSGGRVLPDSSRAFQLSWSDGFPVFVQNTIAGQPVVNKHDQPVLHLHWNFSNTNHLRFGRYYARLTLVYNNGQRDVPVYSTLSFWVIPWKLLLIVLAIIVLQVFLIISLVRYRRLYRKNPAVTKVKVSVQHKEKSPKGEE